VLFRDGDRVLGTHTLFAVLPVFIVGGVAGYLTRAAGPIWGSTVAGVLLVALVGLAARQRVVLEVRAAW
jgi:hypothetical protein